METNDLNNFNLHIDTSSLVAQDISNSEFEKNITEKLQTILNKEFSNNFEKQKIKRKVSSLNFACPFCHDSAIDNKKKRGHLIMSGKFAGIYKCFNCGYTMPFNKFFSHFEQNLSISDIKYINSELTTDVSVYNNTINNAVTSQIINKSEAYNWAVSREIVKNTLGLLDIGKERTPAAWAYLINRCQYKHHERFLYSAQDKSLYILNLIDDRIIGMQIRSIDPNYTGPKYTTFTIDKLRQAFLHDKTPVPDSISRLSCIFNIFQVDFSKTYQMPVLVTEGPFDAFLLPNCIALSGAAKNFAMNFPFWYVYDNDKTGTEHALAALKDGYKVFMWKKFKEEYGLPNRKKWDVTDVMMYLRDHPTNKKLLWSPYFTSDRLNGLYL